MGCCISLLYRTADASKNTVKSVLTSGSFAYALVVHRESVNGATSLNDL
jgi:hypothetical protein